MKKKQFPQGKRRGGEYGDRICVNDTNGGYGSLLTPSQEFPAMPGKSVA